MSGDGEGRRSAQTFSICSRVVLPALSRPRKSSFACLCERPRETRMSQTAVVSLLRQAVREVGLTPVDHPHRCGIWWCIVRLGVCRCVCVVAEELIRFTHRSRLSVRIRLQCPCLVYLARDFTRRSVRKLIKNELEARRERLMISRSSQGV